MKTIVYNSNAILLPILAAAAIRAGHKVTSTTTDTNEARTADVLLHFNNQRPKNIKSPITLIELNIRNLNGSEQSAIKAKFGKDASVSEFEAAQLEAKNEMAKAFHKGSLISPDGTPLPVDKEKLISYLTVIETIDANKGGGAQAAVDYAQIDRNERQSRAALATAEKALATVQAEAAKTKLDGHIKALVDAALVAGQARAYAEACAAAYDALQPAEEAAKAA